MAILVHLTDEKNARSILKKGIKAGKHSGGIYCMPLIQNRFLTYQWLRELKRWGKKNMVAIHFKIDAQESVWAGKYNEKHKNLSVANAFQELLQLEDPQGFEIFIPRKIVANEIKGVRRLPQNIGWRYKPHSHANPALCGCPICIPRGSMKSKKLRDKLCPSGDIRKTTFPTIIKEIREAIGPMTICIALEELSEKKWKADPAPISFLATSKWEEVQMAYAESLANFKYKYSKYLLLDLIKTSKYKSVGQLAFDTLLAMNREPAIEFLRKNNIKPPTGGKLSTSLNVSEIG